MKDLWARKEAFILYEFNQMVVTTPLDVNYVRELKSETVSRRWNSDKNAWIVNISERDKVLEITRQYFDVIEENRPYEVVPAVVAEPIDTISDEKPLDIQVGDKVEIWTDGACALNPGPGSYAVLLRHNGKVREIVCGYELTTKNRMDIMAAIVALESIKSGRAKRWLAKDRKGSNKKERINADLWQRLLDARDKHDFKFIWIKHSSTPENERCNELAEAALSNLLY
jgi:ribonuclease HI